MKATYVLAVAAVALVAGACSGGRADGRAGESTDAIVARVADGDTLVLESGERVRLLQVDSPEVGEGECYGRGARETLEQLVPPGAPVALEADPELDETDEFGRLLRYVLAEGENVNVALVRAGAAAPYFFGANEGVHALDLLDAVNDARQEGVGMWGACEVDWRPDRQVETRFR